MADGTQRRLAALDLGALDLGAIDTVQVSGRVREVVGLSIRAAVPGVRVGETVEIERRGLPPLLAEVVGFHLEDATLLPLGTFEGVGADDVVRPTGRALTIRVGDALLGRVLGGLAEPIDGGPPIEGREWPVMRPPPSPMSRPRIERPLALGVRALDALVPVGEGQRLGIFAGSGVGKSTLLGQIARHAEADVFVACLVGERGREVREFVEDALGSSGLARGVVVCATSDEPALVRLRSAWVATAIAEHFRDEGKRVVLLLDSVTRFARAGREVGLAAGEPPARRGYPPSVFAMLPRLLERSGTSARGSITAFYTVLVEGGDLDEPIADAVRGILDGHVVLDRALAARGRWPAIDPLASLSRLASVLATPADREAAERVRAHVAAYEEKRDLVMLGAYKRGSDVRLDAALSRMDAIERFLAQRADERADRDASLAALRALA